MTTRVIIEIHDVLRAAENLITGLEHGHRISAKKLIEYILKLGHSEAFDLDFWDYIETTLTPTEIEIIDASRISQIIDCVFGDIYKKIANTLGIQDPGILSFNKWIGNDVILILDDKHMENKVCGCYQRRSQKY